MICLCVLLKIFRCVILLASRCESVVQLITIIQIEKIDDELDGIKQVIKMIL